MTTLETTGAECKLGPFGMQLGSIKITPQKCALSTCLFVLLKKNLDFLMQPSSAMFAAYLGSFFSGISMTFDLGLALPSKQSGSKY